MRPIDADKLMVALDKGVPVYAGEDSYMKERFLVQTISDQPTLTMDDLRPKGRWEPEDARFSRCTNCNKSRNIRTQIGWKFCPNCGSDMRGD